MLDAETFRRRHLLLSWVLGLHIPVLFVFGLVQDFSVGDSALEMAPPAVCLVLARVVGNRRLAAFFITAGLVWCSSVLVHFSGGMIEAHFHFFILIGLIALYQDWVPFVWNVVFTVLSHGLGSGLAADAMFNHHAGQDRPWTWALIHGLSVLAACIGVIVFWKNVEQEQQRSGNLASELAASELAAVQTEAAQRRTVSELLVNLARRNQSLLDRQLALISELEQRERDPEPLADLFQLDHLATRIRRNAESLLVLSGDEPPRLWGQPMPLAEVVRAAAAEVEHYRRVEIEVNEYLDVAGQIVADLAHLLAELIENATTFSPPNSRVRVRSAVLPSEWSWVTLSVEDTGIGMADSDIAAANEILAYAPEIDLSSSHLGFHVVSRLARRYGMQVRLAHTPGGGVTALVGLPHHMVSERATSAPPPRQGAVARPLPPPYVSTSPRVDALQAAGYDGDGSGDGHGRPAYPPPAPAPRPLDAPAPAPPAPAPAALDALPPGPPTRVADGASPGYPAPAPLDAPAAGLSHPDATPLPTGYAAAPAPARPDAVHRRSPTVPPFTAPTGARPNAVHAPAAPPPPPPPPPVTTPPDGSHVPPLAHAVPDPDDAPAPGPPDAGQGASSFRAAAAGPAPLAPVPVPPVPPAPAAELTPLEPAPVPLTESDVGIFDAPPPATSLPPELSQTDRVPETPVEEAPEPPVARRQAPETLRTSRGSIPGSRESRTRHLAPPRAADMPPAVLVPPYIPEIVPTEPGTVTLPDHLDVPHPPAEPAADAPVQDEPTPAEPDTAEVEAAEPVEEPAEPAATATEVAADDDTEPVEEPAEPAATATEVAADDDTEIETAPTTEEPEAVQTPASVEATEEPEARSAEDNDETQVVDADDEEADAAVLEDAEVVDAEAPAPAEAETVEEPAEADATATEVAAVDDTDAAANDTTTEVESVEDTVTDVAAAGATATEVAPDDTDTDTDVATTDAEDVEADDSSASVESVEDTDTEAEQAASDVAAAHAPADTETTTDQVSDEPEQPTAVRLPAPLDVGETEAAADPSGWPAPTSAPLGDQDAAGTSVDPSGWPAPTSAPLATDQPAPAAAVSAATPPPTASGLARRIPGAALAPGLRRSSDGSDSSNGPGSGADMLGDRERVRSMLSHFQASQMAGRAASAKEAHGGAESNGTQEDTGDREDGQ